MWTGGEPICDYDRAYDNGGSIADAKSYLPRWQEEARAFRDALAAADRAELGLAYGEKRRQIYDFFQPQEEPKGLVVFVHGGYWKGQEIGNWSHFAKGALDRGFAVALPDYTLCPQATIPEITQEIARFLDEVAARDAGPIRLSGHSAGGHLVTRMLCSNAPISPATAGRIDRVASISGCHDLRPIMRTGMNAVLGLDAATARAESPALLEPRAGIDLLCLCGGAELPEFRRQNSLLANVWHGFGGRTRAVEAPGRHHFDVVDELIAPSSELLAFLTQTG
ncbi:alpha/beta hydrolase [Jiella sp. KSK16Y-1]|uniref:Alpha/beta hydrolase n=1 Tax=Jiella mangrovi TaxID=2821407 RepID=A0ABS4BKD3_9HYPH|nr:alpha/beta hydrolase [Jiella mangrovi]